MTTKQLVLRPSAHVEVFHEGGLVHSSRPEEFLSSACCICGEELGYKSRVVLVGARHAHERCANRRRRR
jgi:hypothetical protein